MGFRLMKVWDHQNNLHRMWKVLIEIVYFLAVK